MKKMNLSLLLLALLAFASYNYAEARAVKDMDNAIEIAVAAAAEPQRENSIRLSHIGTDWLKFTETPPEKVFQTFDSTVEIDCEMMGSQIPNIKWFMGNMPLSEIDDSSESNIISEASRNAMVKVRAKYIVDHILTEPRTFTCVGRNGPKTISASTTVYPPADVKDVLLGHDKPFATQVMPRIIYSEMAHFELIGMNVMFPCKVHAQPPAVVLWIDNNGNLIEQNQHFKLLPTGELLILNIQWEDMGTYSCVARNSFGSDTSEVFLYPLKRNERNGN